MAATSDAHRRGATDANDADEVDLQALAVTLDALPSTVLPGELELLESRRPVIQAKRRARRLRERSERPFYVNTDAAYRYGLAGLAYESATLGSRSELIVCKGSAMAEYLAMLMAMEDAEQVLVGPIAFRTDSSTLANLYTNGAPDLEECRERINALLDRHRNWWIVRIGRDANREADKLARQPFDDMGQNGREFARTRHEKEKYGCQQR
ncbi:MAG: reverse transcriptase-like protein [Solirubrobacteraceae bacterium]